MSDSPVIVALDYHNEADVLHVVEQLSPLQCRLKVGKELFTACGPALVRRLVDTGFDVFLDLKFHDIPNTVAGAVKAARDLGVWMVNVHASGGIRMLSAARNALPDAGDPLLIAVTVLTSMEPADLQQTGVDEPLDRHIVRLAKLAATEGLDGVVCSAREVPILRKAIDRRFCLVTPGIRPSGADLGDQRRVVTPAEAVALGSDYIVIGRPITQAVNPADALQSILESLS